MAEGTQESNNGDLGQSFSKGVGLLSIGAGLVMGRKARERQMQWERYRNAMRGIQDGIQQDVLTLQDIYAQTDTKAKNSAVEIEYMGASGTIAVQGAVSGFNGRTSRAIANSAHRVKNMKIISNEEALTRARKDTEYKRLSSAMGTKLSLEDGYAKPVNYLQAADQAAQTLKPT